MSGTRLPDESVPLVYPASERARAACGAFAMWLIAVGWAAMMLRVGLDRPQTPAAGRPLAVALAGLSTPFFVWGFSYWRRLLASTPTVTVDYGRIVISYDAFLKAPIVLGRQIVSGVAIDEAGAKWSEDELRFQIVTDAFAGPSPASPGRWLYSRFSGCPFPLLDPRERTPNVALMFANPALIESARLARRRPLQVNGGPRALYRSEPALGLLLDVSEPGRLRALIEPWGVLRNVAEGDLLAASRPETYPSLAVATEEEAGPPRVAGPIRRRPNAAVGALGLLWLVAVLAHARSGSGAGGGLAAVLVVGITIRSLRRNARASDAMHRLGTRFPMAVRALLVYPTLSALVFALVLSISQPPANRAVAYTLLPMVATAVLVLTDASAHRAPGNRRIRWALAAAVPALLLSGIALNVAI